MLHEIRARALCTLVAAFLSLSAVAFAEPPLESVLDKATRQVSGFLDQFSDVKCTERVSQAKLNKGGHADVTENSTFDYFVLLQGTGDELTLSESRLEQKRATPPKNTPMLITNGFSTLFLIFHPYYRAAFHFDNATPDIIDGQSLTRVHFTHIPGRRSPAALAVRGREFPLELTGDAWIDPTTGAIARIDTHLANDMHDVGLVSLAVDVDFRPVALPGWPVTYRFPVVATVDVQSLRQRWRNVHRFTNYQRFMVDTQQSVSGQPGK